MQLCCAVFLSFHTNMSNSNTQGIPTYPRESPLFYIMHLMCFVYPHSQWTRWDACDYWQTPYNRTEWHINTVCCSEPHSFVQCKVRKSSFLGLGGGGGWGLVIQNFTNRVTDYSYIKVLNLQGRLVQKPVNVNPGLNVNWSISFFLV